MDKMGSCDGVNKGTPATPRDGAPIELVAMQYSILSWLASLSQSGVIKQKGVKVAGKDILFSDWASKMKASFEKNFWVPETQD